MVDVELFMQDYLAIQGDIDNIKAMAENSVDNLCVELNIELDETEKVNMVNGLVNKKTSEQQKKKAFYEKYIKSDSDYDISSSED